MSRSLSPCPAEVQVERLIGEADHITLVVRAVRQAVPCPGCAQPSSRIHSYYERRLADLPWNGVPVRIRLRTRRFFCDAEDCPHCIFTERLPETTETYARRTSRMEQALRTKAGARTAQRLGLAVSGDTVLRHLRHMSLTQKLTPVPPRVLGMDDWAWRKAQRYGTILCDLERRRVVDLLPDRQSNTVAAWLREHASPEVISRDRAGAYAEAARLGAPGAVQVADRFVAQSARSVGARLGTPHRGDLRGVPAQQLSRERRQRRFERYQQVIALHQRGISQRAIAVQLGMERKTVRHWLRAGQFPERQITPRHSSGDRWLSYLEKRWAEGCHGYIS